MVVAYIVHWLWCADVFIIHTSIIHSALQRTGVKCSVFHKTFKTHFLFLNSIYFYALHWKLYSEQLWSVVLSARDYSVLLIITPVNGKHSRKNTMTYSKNRRVALNKTNKRYLSKTQTRNRNITLNLQGPNALNMQMCLTTLLPTVRYSFETQTLNMLYANSNSTHFEPSKHLSIIS